MATTYIGISKGSRIVFGCPGGVVGSSPDENYAGSIDVESDSSVEALTYLRRRVNITRIDSSRYDGCIRIRYQWRTPA
jgi:hypothetical protein